MLMQMRGIDITLISWIAYHWWGNIRIYDIEALRQQRHRDKV
jgi:hypothetical protein